MKHEIVISDAAYNEIRERLLALGDWPYAFRDSARYREIDLGKVVLRNPKQENQK